MTRITTSLALAAILALTGCSSNPVLDPSTNAKGVDGYSVSVDNYSKISDKNINLTFAVNPTGEIEEFPWGDVEADVIKLLKSKGVKLSSEGRPVTVTLEKFVGHGSHTAFRKIPLGNNLGGIVGALGGSAIQEALVLYADKKIAKNSVEKATSGNGSQFVPEISFKVESTDFEANVNLSGQEALSGYVRATVWIARQAISEYFVPEK